MELATVTSCINYAGCSFLITSQFNEGVCAIFDCRESYSPKTPQLILQGYYKSKFFYGQEPPSGESITTECGVNYQLLAVMY